MGNAPSLGMGIGLRPVDDGTYGSAERTRCRSLSARYGQNQSLIMTSHFITLWSLRYAPNLSSVVEYISQITGLISMYFISVVDGEGFPGWEWNTPITSRPFFSALS